MAKNQDDKVAQQENENKIKQNKQTKTLETKLKIMEDCVLNNRNFKISFFKKLIEIWENSEKQLNELRNKISKQKEYFTKVIIK